MSDLLSIHPYRERVASGLTRILMGWYLFIGATIVSRLACGGG
jgi:hypothetical protein